MSKRAGLLMVALCAAVASAASRPKAYYELIISSEPFGPMAALEVPTAPEAAAAASALEFVRHFLIFERMSAGGNADGFARYCADIIMTAVERVPAGKGAPRSA